MVYDAAGFSSELSGAVKPEGRHPMNSLKTLLLIAVFCLVTSSLFADIYEWTDENGVKHYTNYAPPADSRVLMKTKEVPYDEVSDRARMEADRQAQLELARLEIAEREAELEMRETEADRRLADADRAVQEARQDADLILQEAESNRQVTYRSWSYWCDDGFYGCNPIYRRWYYGKKKYYAAPHRPRHYPEKYFDRTRKDFRRDHQTGTGYHSKAPYLKTNLYYRSDLMSAGDRIGLQSGSDQGLSRISPARPGLGRRR
jgi:hypothetical protein